MHVRSYLRTAGSLICLVAALVAAPAAAREPSSACSSGEVPHNSTPAGVGVRQAGDPYQEATSLYVCSGSVAPGAVWVREDTPGGRTHVIWDGDSTNQAHPCADGYMAARVDRSGDARLYRGDDGDFSFSAGSRSAEEWAAGTRKCLTG